MKRQPLGKILIEMGAIDELQLSAALAYQRKWGMPLGRALIENRLCSPAQLMEALARQIGLPFIDLDKETLSPKQAELLPIKVAEQYRVVPLRLEGERQEVLVIAIAAPAPLASLDAVRSVARKRRVVAHLASDEAIIRAIGRMYRGWIQAEHPEPEQTPVRDAPQYFPETQYDLDTPFDLELNSGDEVKTDPRPVLLYGWTEQAGSTLSALLLSQSMTSAAVGAEAVVGCNATDIVIAPLPAIEELLAAQKKVPGRVLVISKSPHSDMSRARTTGAWGMLSPPLDGRQLAATVQRCRSAHDFLWTT
jgi:type IV pilus assembly protein PilB